MQQTNRIIFYKTRCFRPLPYIVFPEKSSFYHTETGYQKYISKVVQLGKCLSLIMPLFITVCCRPICCIHFKERTKRTEDDFFNTMSEFRHIAADYRWQVSNIYHRVQNAKYQSNSYRH